MITHQDFRRLRLRDFAEDVVDLDNWQFMGRQWIGEAVGFTEWLRPHDDPERLGSLALDLVDLPSEVALSVLKHLGLPLRPGMTYPEVVAELGSPIKSQQFQPDRRSYYFELGSDDRYSLSCTVHEQDGLIYLVVMSVSE